MRTTAMTVGLFAVLVFLTGCAAASFGGPRERVISADAEIVARFYDNMPTGVAVSESGRLFVNFPRWGDDVPFTVAEVVEGEPAPYPSAAFNRLNPADPSASLVSVQSVVVGPRNRLWLLDTGSVEFGPVVPGGAKLVEVDLSTDSVVRSIVLPRDVALPTTYLNDVRIDYTRADAGVAYITDSSLSGPNAIIVVDLKTGAAWRKLDGHPSVTAEAGFLPWVEGQPLINRPANGQPSHFLVGADGLALDVLNDRLWFTSLSSRRLFSVSLDALADRYLPDVAVAQTLRDHGDRGFASDGLESDAQGRLYLTNYEDNAVVVRETDGSYRTIAHDPRMLWPDTLSLGADRSLYFTTNQLHRQAGFQRGRDLREPPFYVWRVPVRATPAKLVP